MNGFFRKPSCMKYDIVNISEWAQMNKLIDSYGPCSHSGDAELHFSSEFWKAFYAWDTT